MLADGTMATGDAGGGVALWDAALGTRLAAFSRHAADVLALAASPDGTALFAAGVDPQARLRGAMRPPLVLGAAAAEGRLLRAAAA